MDSFRKTTGYVLIDMLIGTTMMALLGVPWKGRLGGLGIRNVYNG